MLLLVHPSSSLNLATEDARRQQDTASGELKDGGGAQPFVRRPPVEASLLFFDGNSRSKVIARSSLALRTVLAPILWNSAKCSVLPGTGATFGASCHVLRGIVRDD